MEEIIGFGIILVALNTAIVWWFLGRRKEGGEGTSLLLLQNQLEEIRLTLSQNTKDMRESVVSQFKESQQLIKDITREVSEVKETNKQVFSITESLQNLEKVLKNQKQRGSLGEAGLELILSNVLPPGAYELQYSFANGDSVDACVHTKDGIIPIDAKFSLDNYERIVSENDEVRRAELEKEFKNDLKRRIDETSKYIRPTEGTLPFAIMYIPAEGIYYDLLVNQVGALRSNTRNLIEYAYKDKKVIIVSPTTFVAYLQTILQGFRAFQIEKSAEEIARRVEELARHLKAYEDYHDRLGKSLSTTVNHYNQSTKEIGKIDKDILRITGTSARLGGEVVERPTLER